MSFELARPSAVESRTMKPARRARGLASRDVDHHLPKKESTEADGVVVLALVDVRGTPDVLAAGCTHHLRLLGIHRCFPLLRIRFLIRLPP